MKEIRKQKKKKKSKPTGSISAQPAYLMRRTARQILGVAHPAVSRAPLSF
jgi:hypothetical protein